MKGNPEERRQAAEALKDLIVERKRSRWPVIIGILVLLAAGGGAGYWFHLPPAERPPVDRIKKRFVTWTRRVVNAPVLGAPKAADAPDSASQPDGDAGLLSN